MRILVVAATVAEIGPLLDGVGLTHAAAPAVAGGRRGAHTIDALATGVGLLVALPAVAMFNVFGRWLKTIVARGEVLGDALAAHLEAVPEETAAPKASTAK